MSMETTLTIDHAADDDEQREHAQAAMARLAEAFGVSNEDSGVWSSSYRTQGRTSIASFFHAYQILAVHKVARILSRLYPEVEVSVVEEGHHDEYWGKVATYLAGRQIGAGIKRWVEHPVDE